MGSTGSTNHNVHYVGRLGRKIDYVFSCMHGVAWFEATLVHFKYPGISNSGTVVSTWMARGNATVRKIIWVDWFGQALRIMRTT